MKRIFLTLAAATLALPTVATDAAASTQKYKSTARTRHCRHSAGTTGLVAGGVGGAVVGSKVLGHGLLGAAAGAAGGALAGRAIDRTMTAKKRCTS